MVEVKVLGPGCAKCKQTYEVVSQAAKAVGVEASVQKVTGMMDIAAHGVMGTPAVVVNGQVKCVGKVPSQAEVEAWLRG